MLTTRELLTAVKAAQAIPSNYRLARVLDVTEGTVQRWHTGKNQPDDAMAERLASMAGLDVGYVVACVYAERAANDDSRRIWAGIAKRLQGLVAALAAVIVSALLGVAGDQCAMADHTQRTHAAGPMCIMSTCLRAFWRRWFARRRHGACASGGGCAIITPAAAACT